jgi:LPS sulfotransferase NodH
MSVRRETERISRAMSAEQDGERCPCTFRYLICSSPRTGSSLLTIALREAGLAGIPYEYLHPGYARAFADRFGLTTVAIPAYLDFLEQRRCSRNGVLGMKLHLHQLRNALPGREQQIAFLQRFDRCIVLNRRNQLAQAISLLRANASRMWATRDADELKAARAAPFAPSTAAIARVLADVVAEAADWPPLVAAAGRDCITLAYEDLVADFAGAMRRIVTHLAIDGLRAEAIRPPTTLKLADAASEAAAERFLRDIKGG